MGGHDVGEQGESEQADGRADDERGRERLLEEDDGQQRAHDHIGVADESRAAGAEVDDGHVVQVNADATDDAADDELRIAVEIVELKHPAGREQRHDQCQPDHKSHRRKQPRVHGELRAQQADDERVGHEAGRRREHEHHAVAGVEGGWRGGGVHCGG